MTLNIQANKSNHDAARRSIFQRLSLGLLATFILAANPSPTVAAPAEIFSDWLAGVRQEATKLGIAKETLDAALTGIQPIRRVIELDQNQPEFKLTFRQYLTRVVPERRVQIGKQKLRENRALLEEIALKYGVQARFIVAFWGVETDFGRITGGFPVVPALATLAHEGSRHRYFRTELLNALKILDGHHITVDKMVGSWAGAMGQCQFMPSSFLNFAVDHDGDGRKDIWTKKADVFASAANYLKRSGWNGNQTWGRQVTVPTDFDRKLANPKIKKSLSEWQAIGVRRADGSDLPTRNLMAAVVFPEKKGGPAYLIYNNFHTIMKWNRSTYFAIAVGTLAERIGNG